MKVCVTMVLMLLVHQICAYPVLSKGLVTDLQRALASLLVRAQLKEQAEYQRNFNEEALAQEPCIQDGTNGCNKQEANAHAQEPYFKEEAKKKILAQKALLYLLAKEQANEEFKTSAQDHQCPPPECSG